MARIVNVEHHLSLDHYAEVPQLSQAVRELRAEAAGIAPRLEGRRVWMVNSTEQGGGVAEMLPTMATLLGELGVDVRWMVMETRHEAFFPLTKRIHNLIHGEGEPELSAADRELYDAVSRESAAAMREHLGPDDVLVVHDPQPLGAGALLRRELGLPALWRCHIGLDQRNAQTRAAWQFLQPHAEPYDHAIFTLPEYIPSYLAGRATVIHPAIDPLSHKNRELPLHKLVGVLCDSQLAVAHEPVLRPPFDHPAQRMQRDGSFAPATEPGDIGLLFRPVVVQISRWDRLKGFTPLLEGFARLKRELTNNGHFRNERHQRTVEIARLVLAGPDPESVADDPEAVEVLDEMRALYTAVEPQVRRDIAIVALPMDSRKRNALMVNALQRSATVVAQNSLREGFGLTATEAMWKGAPVMAARSGGLRAQVRDGLDGRLVDDPADPDNVAAVLSEMLASEHHREDWGRSAERRALSEFLIFTQLRRWMEVLDETVRNRGE